MPTTNHNATPGSIDSDLPTTSIFELLANDRRRLALHYLTQNVGDVRVSDLADQVALWEGEHTYDRYERICTALVHVHLPKLDDAGVVEYDPEHELVGLRTAADALGPYLELTAPVDVQ